jgi:hypothetical protein
LVFDGHTRIRRNLFVLQHLGHFQQGVPPGLHLGRPDAVAGGSTVVGADHLFDVVTQGVV